MAAGPRVVRRTPKEVKEVAILEERGERKRVVVEIVFVVGGIGGVRF